MAFPVPHGSTLLTFRAPFQDLSPSLWTALARAEASLFPTALSLKEPSQHHRTTAERGLQTSPSLPRPQLPAA